MEFQLAYLPQKPLKVSLAFLQAYARFLKDELEHCKCFLIILSAELKYRTFGHNRIQIVHSFLQRYNGLLQIKKNSVQNYFSVPFAN